MHRIYRVKSLRICDSYVVVVGFDDGTEQRIDFEPVLRGEVYGPLLQPHLFRQVAIDPDVHTLVWPNGADFDPETLHDWPLHAREWAERARAWES